MVYTTFSLLKQKLFYTRKQRHVRCIIDERHESRVTSQ